MFILSAVAGFLTNKPGLTKSELDICKEYSIRHMKNYIDKVEKELKDKEGFKFESLPPRKQQTYTEKGIDRLKSILIET